MMNSSAQAAVVAALIVYGAHAEVAAQTDPTIVVRRAPLSYAPLVNPAVLPGGDDGEHDVNSPFPIRFYGNTYSTLRVGDNGAILFPASGQAVSFNNPAPGPDSVNNWIAPLWDDLRMFENGRLSWAVEGTAPRRRLSVEWRNTSRCCAEGNVDATFRVVFLEAPVMDLRVEYGRLAENTSRFSATLAMEDSLGENVVEFSPQPCGRACGTAEILPLSNTRVSITEDAGPDLIAQGLRPPELAFIGVPSSVAVEVFNRHANAIGPFAIRLEGSSSPDFANPVVIGSQGGFGAPGFALSTLQVPAVPPSGLGDRMYVRALLDPTDAVTEVSETNNEVSAPVAVRLLPGAPDIAVTSVRPAVIEVDSGQTFEVVTRVQNEGSMPAQGVTVRLLLSSNPVISPRDVGLADFTVSLAAGETTTATASVTVDPNTRSGAYFVGALADPDDAITELSDVNNGLASDRSLTVNGASLAVATMALPPAYVGFSYVARVEAAGAGEDATFRVAQGSLPRGLDLAPATGEIFGRPTTVETQTFTVQVTSRGQTSAAEFTMVVTDPEQALSVVTRAVSAGIVGREYMFTLVAGGGGTSRLTWSASSLPPGIRIQPDGALIGTPEQAGTTSLALTVSNGTQTARRTMPFEVVDNTGLRIVPAALSTGRFDEPYRAQLRAQGGLPPYRWRIAGGGLPDGLALDAATGEVSGVPRRVGRAQFTVEALDSGPEQPATDVNAFEIEVLDDGRFSIAATALAPARLAEPYDQALTAMGGQPPLTWAIEDGRLPAGITGLGDADGLTFRLFGTAELAGVSNFVLRAEDARGRVARQAFALKVEAAPVATPTDSGGCRAVGRGTVGPVLVLVGVLLVVRRRRRADGS